MYVESLSAAHAFAWSRSSSMHSTVHPWPLMAWTIFWFPILYGLLPLGAGLCLIVDFFLSAYSFTPFVVLLPFLPYHSAIPAVMLFDPCLLDLFHWIYTHVTLGFLDPLYCLWAPLTHLLSSWASLTHLLSLGILGLFPNSAFSWAFTNSFRLSWPNCLILHPWGSWAFHQPLTFLLHYFEFVVVHSYFSTSHNAHGFTTYLSGLL